MAVSFKVPKSPKRNIAASENFIGVDLTNTGVNVDGSRSPNAPNMVRHVPGKVRKRMGYFKEILFGTDENVNFAAGTSAQEKQFFIDEDQVETWVSIYDLIQEISSDAAYTLNLEFDYKSEADFNIIDNTTIVTASEDWEHISTSVNCLATDIFSDVKIYSEVEQAIYIKNFALLKTRTESYEWSPAPKYFVERETNDPVYGCHYLRNGKDSFEGDRVVNVNRALNTSAQYTTLTIQGGHAATELYSVAEIPLTEVTFDFDYTSDKDLRFYFGGYYSGMRTIPASETESHFTTTYNRFDGHCSIETTLPELLKTSVYLQGVGEATFRIRNFTATYEKDDNYAWSPAPEDIGETFPLDEVYYETNAEHAVSDTVEVTGTYHHELPSAGVTANLGNMLDADVPHRAIHVSFDLTTTITGGTYALSGGSEAYVDNDTDHNHIYCETYGGLFNQTHFDIIATNTEQCKIHVVINLTASANRTIKAKFENISVKEIVVNTSFYRSPKWYLYHVGKDFYLRPTGNNTFRKVYSDANEHISRSWQLNNNSYIIDGKDIYQFTIEEGQNVEVIGQDNATIPLVTIAKEPSGGGTSYYPLNMLQPGFYEQFQGRANVKEFQLSFSGLDNTTCKAWLLNSNAEWVEKVENTDFTVDRTTGKVTFITAPGVSPIDGEDNVKILAYRTVEGYRDRVVKCTFGTMFGVGGACDRIFLSGNPDRPNWDFYSQRNDATYFADLWYSTLGSEQSAIKGYAIVSNYLASFKDGFDQSQSVFIREGDMLEVEEGMPAEATFKIINTLQGEGAISPYTFGYLQTEPVFLTKAGIYAITEQDITGEKYSQNRSFYLDGKLRHEDNMSTAMATVYDNQYILALNNQFYVLDGLQATRTDKSEPYATRQYAGFYCTDIPASCLWTDDQICFGTSDGKVCRFYSDEEALESYNDDGKAIYCCWETPDLDGQLFYKNKTFRYFAVRIMKAIKTSVKLYSRKLGIWTLNQQSEWTFIKEQTSISNMLDFNNLDFNLLSFSADMTERVIHTKLRVKKVDKARFRVENGELNEPFGLSDLALEYIESGNYKG